MARIDPHSYADDAQPRTRSLAWIARVDFEAKVLHAEVTLTFAAPSREAGPLDLDTRDLAIEAVTDQHGAALPFTLHPPEPVFGARLELTLPAGTQAVRVRYRTSPKASALQWLEPAQTLGGKQPYLFSQCQAIHARSVLPCQDTPSFRVSFTASLTVPRGLTAVMAAAPKGRTDSAAGGTFAFEMPQPIPPYLFAFAVGELASKDLSNRSRVWTEPGQLAAAAWEFADVEKQVRAAESLFGPYDWDRFDLLVMPPSFPYGGMENPRLTFLTPSLLAGDKSLVNVVAHELAHSWTGNLVTNTTAEHFWLNEGFTVFAERRILEVLEGPELTALHAAIGFKDLEAAIERFKAQPELTRLRTHLEGLDPDETFSQVPYEKGYLFLKALEGAAGRAAFDPMLKSWLQAHRFGAATTEDFLAHVETKLPGVLASIDAKAWVEGAGLPANAPRPRSARLAAVQALKDKVPSRDAVRTWSPAEWQLYLESMSRPASSATLDALDQTFSLTAAKNSEVLVAWLVLACESGYLPPLGRAEKFLGEIGRMKYLRPLFKALASRPESKTLARSLFERYRPRYHPIAQHVLTALLDQLGA